MIQVIGLLITFELWTSIGQSYLTALTKPCYFWVVKTEYQALIAGAKFTCTRNLTFISRRVVLVWVG